jgi:hypothetical protein
MNPFETLYGRKCNKLVSWDNPVDRSIIGMDLWIEMEENITKIE